MTAKHHKELEDMLSPSKKLECWNRLVEFLQMLLNVESNPPSKEETQKHSAENLSHDKEDDLSDSSKAVTSREETEKSHDQLGNVGLSGVKDNSSVFVILKLLEEKYSNSDTSVALRTLDVKLPTHSPSSGAYSNTSSQTILPTAVHSMYKTLVYKGIWETQSSKVILVQVQSVLATIVMTFDLQDFTKVIQDIVVDVVSIYEPCCEKTCL